MSTTADPPVSVLLPVYNGGRHLAGAVDSILAQTHRNLELLIIDDGSTDGSGAYLDGLPDPRVRVQHQANRGLVATLNRGLDEARHELVARMDADDLSHPRRLELQVAHLVAHPEVAAVGSCYEVIDEDDNLLDTVHLAADAAYLRRQLYFRNVLPHGGMTFRGSLVRAVGGYRDVGPVEDYDLWIRLAERHDLANLPTPLFSYRVTATGVSVQSRERQQRCLEQVRDRLHERRPLTPPGACEVARQGVAHVHRYGPTCRGTAQWYAFDHTWLALLLARRGRWLPAARLALGVALLTVRHPSGVRGLPPVRRLAALVRDRVRAPRR